MSSALQQTAGITKIFRFDFRAKMIRTAVCTQIFSSVTYMQRDLKMPETAKQHSISSKRQRREPQQLIKQLLAVNR
jgi:hypothetical protein